MDRVSSGEAGLVAELAGLGAPCGMRGASTASASPRPMPKAMKQCRRHRAKSWSRARIWARWSQTCRRSHLLAAWVREAETNGPGPIPGFAGFLRQDWDAVLAGMTLAYSSGVTEGRVGQLAYTWIATSGRPPQILAKMRAFGCSSPKGLPA